MSNKYMGDGLAAYQGRTAQEAADLERVRAWLGSAGAPWDRATDLHFTASALIVHPPSGRVLLRWHARQEAWLQVGGHADAGESDALAIALREGREETGLSDLVPWPDRELLHVVIVPVKANAKEPVHEHVDLRFVLATERPEDVRPENPAAELRWLSFDEARSLTEEPNLRESLRRVEALR
jgi:8-oxo-dGTP pyrophosphatase MutT (NUDIX family)